VSLEVTVVGEFAGVVGERTNPAGVKFVTGMLNAVAYDGLVVQVNATAAGPLGLTLLGFRRGEKVEATGHASPRVLIGRKDQPQLVIEMLVNSVRRAPTHEERGSRRVTVQRSDALIDARSTC
jgi:hypothetical protein